MATGKQMLEAVLQAVRSHPDQKELRLSIFDAIDLGKLTPSDLQELGVDLQRSEQISGDLLSGSFDELGNWLGTKLVRDKAAKNLIPGEGFRRTAGIWWTGDYDPDALVEEIRQLRNPGAT
ncbi:MAG TPA: hypothetical protein VHY91_26410 [Pirellulales bacterium]|jgi:hypothetical protein|nr:hypothetical protein [Pirellulales bacterium]